MFITLKGSHIVLNGALPKNHGNPKEIGILEFAGGLHLNRNPECWRLRLPAGRYEVERAPNPYGYKCSWLVLYGTFIGMAESAWRQREGPEWEEFQIIIEE